jgi:hypothetical protein
MSTTDEKRLREKRRYQIERAVEIGEMSGTALMLGTKDVRMLLGDDTLRVRAKWIEQAAQRWHDARAALLDPVVLGGPDQARRVGAMADAVAELYALMEVPK